MKQKLQYVFLLILFLRFPVFAQSSENLHPKREFRAAWIQTVNGQFQGMPSQKMQQTLLNQLDALQAAGINAIIFQIRPEADSFYQSNMEPWSRFLTGTQGQTPNPYWDPLQFMIDECHKRCMELHAWINPYRALTNVKNGLVSNHLYFKHPERFVQYGNQIYFNPAYKENRDYICKVVADVVARYDVDGIHMDDYFYPYPVGGLDYPDDVAFYAQARGFNNRGDWRRDNVNQLIKQLYATVHDTKHWVKFGISPFGIYRNQKSDPNGSETNGLQNYDDLYADVLLWMREGWVDYILPQIYWHVGHPRADYETLIRWWANNTGDCQLYIGESVMNTVENKDPEYPNQNQLPRKMTLQRSLSNVQGSCQWPASAVVENAGGYTDMLKQQYHKYPALIPAMRHLDHHAPKKVRKVKSIWTSDGYILFWNAPKGTKEMDKAVQYVIYRFENKKEIDLNDATKIVAVTRENNYKLPYVAGKQRYYYVITALDRLHNESKPETKMIKL